MPHPRPPTPATHDPFEALGMSPPGGIDPFVLSLASGAAGAISSDVAVSAILLAAASNDVAKAGYALMFGDRRVGRVACLALVVLAGVTAALAFR